MPIPPAASYISCPLQPHLLYNINYTDSSSVMASLSKLIHIIILLTEGKDMNILKSDKEEKRNETNFYFKNL